VWRRRPAGGARELAHGLGHVAARLLPRHAEALAVLVDVGAAASVSSKTFAAVARLAADEALVGEQLERGVDRAGLGRQTPSLRDSSSCITW